jgi:UDP-N-acetylglucosamine--N-acetylmuramyl-(pentapeptide) pyrophosphoryl-undecaprenol N-acetylglucosamine transferase
MFPLATKITAATSATSARVQRGVEQIGNPSRSISGATSGVAREHFKIPAEAPVVLALGGGTGSASVNRIVTEALASWPKEWHVIHLFGPERDRAQAEHCASMFANYHPFAFLSADIGLAYAAADVVIARAGASTIAELAHCGKPAVLIPYPHARAHQRENVRLVESVGGGVWLDEATATPQRLAGLARQLLGDARLRVMMGQQMHTLAAPQATERLAGAIRRLAHQGRTTTT